MHHQCPASTDSVKSLLSRLGMRGSSAGAGAVQTTVQVSFGREALVVTTVDAPAIPCRTAELATTGGASSNGLERLVLRLGAPDTAARESWFTLVAGLGTSATGTEETFCPFCTAKRAKPVTRGLTDVLAASSDSDSELLDVPKSFTFACTSPVLCGRRGLCACAGSRPSIDASAAAVSIHLPSRKVHPLHNCTSIGYAAVSRESSLVNVANVFIKSRFCCKRLAAPKNTASERCNHDISDQYRKHARPSD